ncbi:MAG: cytochrome c biogenesis protein CcsA [Nitrospinota bacterium]
MTYWIVVSIMFYTIGTVKYLLFLGLKSRLIGVLATLMIAAGFLSETIGLIDISMQTGHGPYQTRYEQFLFGGWTTFGLFLIIIGYFRIKPLGAFMAPIGLLFMVLASLFSAILESPPPLKMFWLTMHQTISFIYFSAFVLVFAAGAMYLLQEYELKHKHFGLFYKVLPSLALLDNLNRVGLILGLPLIMVSLISASFWSHHRYGLYMKHDLSTVAMMAAVLFYLSALIGRSLFNFNGHKAALISIIGFIIMLLGLFNHII